MLTNQIAYEVNRLSKRRAEIFALSEMEPGENNLEAKQISLSLSNMQTTALAQVEAAMERVHEGCYGLCGICEEPIPAKRLRLLPEALYCVGCAPKSLH